MELNSEDKKIIDYFMIMNSNKKSKLEYDPEKVKRMRQILSTPEGVDYLITYLSAEKFYDFCEKFDVPAKVIQARQKLERFVVLDKDETNIEVIKESLAGLIFRCQPEDSLLLIGSIKERANYLPEFAKMIGKYEELFEKTEILFKMTNENVDWNKAEECISYILDFEEKLKSSGKNIFTSLKSMERVAKEGLKRDIQKEVGDSVGKITKGITPETIEVQGVKVPLYRIQNQTKNQRDFAILARTSSVDQQPQPGQSLEEFYAGIVSGKDYLSYSLFNEHLVKGYNGTYSITFGYAELPDVSLISANTHDGQTNAWPITEDFHVMRQEYLPVQEFLDKTAVDHYNELVFSNPEKFLPKYIIVSEKDLASGEKMKIIAEISAKFNLPLILIDTKSYANTCKNGKYSSEGYWSQGYTHSSTLKYNLTKAKEKMQATTCRV